VFGVFTETTATGKFLELFWSRVQDPHGTTNMDFELNQKFCDPSATPTNCAGNGVTPLRTNGDKLITYDLSGGGTNPTISIRTWDGSAWGAPTVISGSGGTAIGSINTSTIAAADSGGIGAQDPFTFGEAAIAFTALFPPGGECGGFGSAYLKSRSSDSFNAEIKDFIAPERVTITNCTEIQTTLSATSITVGGSVHDSATLTGATGNAGGTVTYTVYTDNACTQNPRDAGTVTVTNGVVPNSNTLQFNSVGTFYWQAVYSGDLNNAGSTSDCTTEVLVVNKAQPTITTSPDPSSGTVGVTLNDSATLAGGSNPTGSIVFRLFGPNNPTCDPAGPAAVFTQTVTVTGNGTYSTTGGHTTTELGTYHWTASYSGDANNESAASACADEAVVISQAASAIATDQFVYPNDAATVSEAVTGNITGDVQFRLFDTLANCQSDDGTDTAAGLLYKQTVALPATTTNSKTVETSNTSVRVSDDATVYWRVIYSGDAQHGGRLSDCVENTALDFTDDPGPGTAP
jgi:hypothetical protein